MANDRDCENCIHKINGACESWDCGFEPKEELHSDAGILEYVKPKSRKFIEIIVEYPPAESCIYPEYKGKPYFSIKYEENGKHIIGFGTYNPEVLTSYLQEYFISDIQPKTGHWIYDRNIENWRCSECGETPKTLGYCGTADFMAEHFKYCNHCGVGMVEPQESEKINCKTTKCENCQNHNYCDYEPQESEEKPKSEWEHDHEILKAYSDGASAVLDKIRAEIDAARFLDKDKKLFKNANASGLEVAMDIIDKHKAEGSGEE